MQNQTNSKIGGFTICQECGYHAGDLKQHFMKDHGYNSRDAGQLVKEAGK